MAGFGIEAARVIVAEALAKGVAAGMKPLSVIVLDAGGHVMAFERSDGASPGRFGIAQAKAYGAIMLGIGGRAQQARAETQAFFMAAANGIYGGKVMPVAGGILVRDATGAVVAAVGVTGDSSDNDALAGEAGIRAAGFQPEA
jgi:uncharacterized protein GlcG (DUF336 family)